MRTEKQSISQEYVARLNASPFFIVVEYTGLKVGPITELRKRLVKAGAEAHKEPWDAFWGMRYAIVHDPDGNSVELFCPTS